MGNNNYIGQIYCDGRGSLTCFNEFNPAQLGIKRTYLLQNRNDKQTRGMHAHRYESKWLQVISGAALINYYEVIDWETGQCSPQKGLKTKILDARNPWILQIPAGYSHGWRHLEENTILMVYSDKTLEESKHDDYRFKWDLFGKEIWEIKNY